MEDEEYFRKRLKIDTKHYMLVSQWINHFNPDTVLDCGCGPGHYIKAFRDSDVDCIGFDISKYIIDLNIYNFMEGYWCQNILEEEDIKVDLVIAFDILEHLNGMTELRIALKNLKKWSKKDVLISVPVIGDPNLELDPTHNIHMTREQWLKEFKDAGFVIKQTPDWFYYKNQIYILEVKK